MATVTWTGNAADVQQISTLTVASTWLATETATLTINGKDLVLTLVTNLSTANVAIALKEMWMSGTRLDGTGTTDATSNCGGQQFGEFAEVTATVSGSVVYLKANTPGVPFVVSVAETSASGTLTLATPQACTGKHYWSDADNWDSGSVPANDDTVVFRDSDISVRYGLPNGSKEVTIQQYQSYTGEIGLPAINISNVGKPYYEYRQRYVRLDDAGGGTNIAHRFGIGQTGTGSPLINLKHSTLKTTPIVYNTGTPLNSRPGTKALNICATATSSEIYIVNGSVDFSSQDGSTSAWVTVNQTNGNSRCIQGIHTTGASVTVSGGSMLVGGTGAINYVLVNDGTLRLENQTGAIASLYLVGGRVDHASTATIAAAYMTGGTYDASSDAGAVTFTNCTIWPGAKFFDPFARVTASNPITVYVDPGPNFIFGASPNRAISITP